MTDILATNNNDPDGSDLEENVRAMLTVGQIIAAVKHVRYMTRLDLAASRKYVYDISTKMRAEDSLREARSYVDLLSELASLRRQIAVLEHEKRMLCDVLHREVGDVEFNVIMNNIRATTPKGSE